MGGGICKRKEVELALKFVSRSRAGMDADLYLRFVAVLKLNFFFGGGCSYTDS